MRPPSPWLVTLTLLLSPPGCGPTAAVRGSGTTGSGSGTTGPGTTDETSAGPSTDTTGSTTGATGPGCAQLGQYCDMQPCCEGECLEIGGDPICELPGGSDSGFIMDPDGGVCAASTPAGTLAHCSQCDPWLQDCPGGSKCTAWANDGGNAWNAVKCAPVDRDPGQPGDPCQVEGWGASGQDTCEIGSMCWDVDPATLEGTCVALCTGTEDSPVCDPGLACTILNDGVLNLCLPACDPLTQDCPGGQPCIPGPGGDGFVCTVDPTESGAAGDPCEYLNACAPGLFCAVAESVVGCVGAVGCCAPYCDLTDPMASESCPGAPEETCVPWFEMGTAPVGLEHVGACVVPGP